MEIKNTHSQVIFSGHFSTFKKCLEQAVIDNIDLTNADLRYKNLTQANLDNACLNNVNFKGANLTGANMSEANIKNANFVNTALEGTCFAFSDLQSCDFAGAQFGATDIAGTTLDGSCFSTQSCFHLNFIDSKSLRDCSFLSNTGQTYGFSKPPLLMHGLPIPIVCMDDHIKIGTHFHPKETFLLTLNTSTPNKAANENLFAPALHRHRRLLSSILTDFYGHQCVA